MINRNNYEAYLMDYIDGKLNAVEVSEVLLFLEQNPHIQEELNGLKEIHLSEQDLPGPDFSLLMKPTYKDEKQKFETLIISKLEGEISEENSSILQKGLLIYPELTHDIYLFEQTKLTPDTSIVFPNKHALKKGGWAVPLWQNGYSRAAAIALLAIGLWLLMKEQPQHEKSIANMEYPTNSDIITKDSTSIHQTESPLKNRIDPVGIKPHQHIQKTTGHKHQIADAETTDIYYTDSPKNAINVIEGIAPSFSQDLAYEFPKLDCVDAFKLNNVVETNETAFPTIGRYLKNKINEETTNWWAKNEWSKPDKFLTTINKITRANIVFEKDSQTNIINKFEVAGIGIAWSGKK